MTTVIKAVFKMSGTSLLLMEVTLIPNAEVSQIWRIVQKFSRRRPLST